jgi:hypothetical protein
MKRCDLSALIVLQLFVLSACQVPANEAEEASGSAAVRAASGTEAVTAENPCPSLVGSWALETIEESSPALTESFESDPNYQIAPTLKILNDTHWMFIRQSADQLIFAQGGRYSLDNGKYKETVEYSAIPENVGISFEFECELEGDSLWPHVGGLGDSRYNEVWRRVD